jgi:DNA polymerase-3 subunit gamma/tau
MMIKGISELQVAPIQIDALEMILIRVAYSASLPTPYELLNDVKKNSDLRFVSPQSNVQKTIEEKVVPVIEINKTEENQPQKEKIEFNKVEDLVRFLEDKKYPLLVYALKHDVCIKEFSNGVLKIIVSDSVHPEFIQNCVKVLRETTGENWQIEVLKGLMGETLADKEEAALAEKQKDILEYPLVKAIMAEFKGAKIESLTRRHSKGTDEEDDVETTNNLIFDEDNES